MGPGAELSGVSGLVGAGICTILHLNFAEFTFDEVGGIEKSLVFAYYRVADRDARDPSRHKPLLTDLT
jgi:hypothetical protein